MRRRILTMSTLATLVLLSLTPVRADGRIRPPTPGPGACSATPGTEWRRYGRDLANTRWQPTTSINAGNVGNIAKSWVFDAQSIAHAGVLNGGTFQNTPVVADGCVYASSSTGWVFALNADTGQRVWTSQLMPGSPAGDLLGGIITGSPTVTNGKVYVAVANLNDPYVVALDQATGQTLWIASVVDPAKKHPTHDHRLNVVAAPVVHDGLIFQGIMAEEDKANARGGYAILNAETGALIHQDWTITDGEYAAGYRGASVWCTAAVDTDTGYVYACGGNPASKQVESRYSNALLKIDMRCSSATKTLAACRADNPTFGKIVDAYKGNVDQYYPGLERQPACDQVPTTLVWSPTCAQLDLDFGSSPSLYTITVGNAQTSEQVKLLGDLQKSGIYHAVYADNMEMAWTSVVGAPGPTFNAASPAVDGSQVYTAAVPPGQMWALSRDRGRYRWVAPIATGGATHFQSVSTAGGVVFTMDNLGTLHAFDAATGLILKRWPISLDTGRFAGALSSQGVSIARDTVYAASGAFIAAYN